MPRTSLNKLYTLRHILNDWHFILWLGCVAVPVAHVRCIRGLGMVNFAAKQWAALAGHCMVYERAILGVGVCSALLQLKVTCGGACVFLHPPSRCFLAFLLCLAHGGATTHATEVILLFFRYGSSRLEDRRPIGRNVTSYSIPPFLVLFRVRAAGQSSAGQRRRPPLGCPAGTTHAPLRSFLSLHHALQAPHHGGPSAAVYSMPSEAARRSMHRCMNDIVH